MTRKSLSSKLSRRDPTDDELDAAIAEFRSSHDRAAAIMGAALVERALVDAIQVCLDDDSDAVALFYDEKAPFGTFHARITAARAFAMISDDLAKDLHIIRDVRNQFAHAIICLTFKNTDIAAKCEKLKHHPEWVGQKRRISASRKHYQNACHALAVHLFRAANDKLAKRKSDLERQLSELRAGQKIGIRASELSTLAKLLEAYGLRNDVSTGLKDSGDDVPDNVGADKF